MFRERLIQTITDHSEAWFWGGPRCGEKRPQPRERILTIEVIRIDRGKRRLDHLPRRTDRVRRAPRLGPPGRHREPCGQIVQSLKRIIHLDRPGVFRANGLAEGLLEIPPDHEHHAVESGAHGIEHRIVHDRFAGRPHRLDLLQPAVPAAHTRRQNHQCRLHVRSCFPTSPVKPAIPFQCGRSPRPKSASQKEHKRILFGGPRRPAIPMRCHWTFNHPDRCSRRCSPDRTASVADQGRTPSRSPATPIRHTRPWRPV